MRSKTDNAPVRGVRHRLQIVRRPPLANRPACASVVFPRSDAVVRALEAKWKLPGGGVIRLPVMLIARQNIDWLTDTDRRVEAAVGQSARGVDAGTGAFAVNQNHAPVVAV